MIYGGFEECYVVCKAKNEDTAVVGKLSNISIMQTSSPIDIPKITLTADVDGRLKLIQMKQCDAITDEDFENIFM